MARSFPCSYVVDQSPIALYGCHGVRRKCPGFHLGLLMLKACAEREPGLPPRRSSMACLGEGRCASQHGLLMTPAKQRLRSIRLPGNIVSAARSIVSLPPGYRFIASITRLSFYSNCSSLRLPSGSKMWSISYIVLHAQRACRKTRLAANENAGRFDCTCCADQTPAPQVPNLSPNGGKGAQLMIVLFGNHGVVLYCNKVTEKARRIIYLRNEHPGAS